jgi:hypothetical protein
MHGTAVKKKKKNHNFCSFNLWAKHPYVISILNYSNYNIPKYDERSADSDRYRLLSQGARLLNKFFYSIQVLVFWGNTWKEHRWGWAAWIQKKKKSDNKSLYSGSKPEEEAPDYGSIWKNIIHRILQSWLITSWCDRRKGVLTTTEAAPVCCNNLNSRRTISL